jgi:hypothetical protein
VTPRSLVIVATLLSACASVEDILGPAVGYAELDGFVRDGNGDPVSGVEVLLDGCAPPAIGEVGRTFTGSDGGYTLEAKLPPVGVVQPLARDSVIIQCVLMAARDTSSVVNLDLWFWADPALVQPVAVDLSIR